MENNDIREFSKKMLALQEEERRRISRDLHDEAGQLSVSLGSALSVIEKEIEKRNFQNAHRVIKDAKSLLTETTKKIKKLVLDIRPAELDILGLPAVLREHFSYYTKTYPLKIKFKENIGSINIDGQVAITLYRVIQEALNNIVKHSKAKRVEIDLLIEKGDIVLSIYDNGRGFEVEDVLKETNIENLGIRGMKERVDLLNGEFSIKSRHRGGTMIRVCFPMEE